MVGEKLGKLREEKGLTQEELAAAVGVSPYSIQSYEENRWSPGTKTMARIATALQVPITVLVEGYDAIIDANGDTILVEKSNGCRIKVYGVFKKPELGQQ